jgi:hypothetical protein
MRSSHGNRHRYPKNRRQFGLWAFLIQGLYNMLATFTVPGLYSSAWRQSKNKKREYILYIVFTTCDILCQNGLFVLQSELYKQPAECENQQKMVAAEIQKQALVSKTSETHTKQNNSTLEQLRQVLAFIMITHFTSPCCPDWLWGPPNLLYNGYRGLFPGGKEAGAWSWPLTSN